jgi:hypothetical protein
MLEGTELLEKVRSMKDAGRSDIVRACGFVSQKQDGSERLNFTAFYEALLEAKGVELSAPKRMGRKLTYKTKIQGNGNLLIGSAYTKECGFEPGQEFEIKLGRNSVKVTAAAAAD